MPKRNKKTCFVLPIRDKLLEENFPRDRLMAFVKMFNERCGKSRIAEFFALMLYEEIPAGEPKDYKVYIEVMQCVSH